MGICFSKKNTKYDDKKVTLILLKTGESIIIDPDKYSIISLNDQASSD